MLTLQGNTLTLKPEGEFTIYQAESFKKEVLAVFGEANEVIVNLSKTTKIDTATFQLLVALKKSCEKSQKEFDVVGVKDPIHNFLELFNAREFLLPDGSQQ